MVEKRGQARLYHFLFSRGTKQVNQNSNLPDEVAKNAELVKQLMAEASGTKATQIQAGNKAVITVHIDNYEGDSGTVYNGTLFFKRPSAMDYIRIGAIKSELLRGFGIRPIIELITNPADGSTRPYESLVHVDSTITYLAAAIALCDVALQRPIPAWFENYRDTVDPDLVMHVWQQFEEQLVYFRVGAQGVPAGDIPARVDEKDVVNEEAIREREPAGDGGNTPANRPATRKPNR